MKPTEDTYTELQTAFDHFNSELFSGQIPACLITLQREKKTYGYFSPSRFIRHDDGVCVDEIAMNPAYFAITPVEEVMQTLVHEMVHAWQAHFGNPGRRRYHNHEWAAKMEEVGLIPSSTGKPGGQRTGEHMGDYPLPGGRFEQACQKLFLTDFTLSWRDRYPERYVTAETISSAVSQGLFVVAGGDISEGETFTKPKPTRYKYSCARCQTNVWGKPRLSLICGICGGQYT